MNKKIEPIEGLVTINMTAVQSMVNGKEVKFIAFKDEQESMKVWKTLNQIIKALNQLINQHNKALEEE